MASALWTFRSEMGMVSIVRHDPWIAVGTLIAERPPHRAEWAQLARLIHWAEAGSVASVA